MLKFAVSVYRILRPDSAHPLKTYSPKCLEDVAFSEVCTDRGPSAPLPGSALGPRPYMVANSSEYARSSGGRKKSRDVY